MTGREQADAEWDAEQGAWRKGYAMGRKQACPNYPDGDHRSDGCNPCDCGQPAPGREHPAVCPNTTGHFPTYYGACTVRCLSDQGREQTPDAGRGQSRPVRRGNDHPSTAQHIECLTNHGGRGVARHCQCGMRWPCPMTPPASTPSSTAREQAP